MVDANLRWKWGRAAIDLAPLARIFTVPLALAMVTAGGFGLRLFLWTRYPFREDEAIYSYWALHFWREDALFLHVWPDKPPLFLWTLAGVFRLLGPTETSARWLNIALSTLLIPVVAATAYRAWGKQAAIVSAAAIALSPFAISFAPTAFTDPMLVLAGALALCMALYRCPFWAGVWLGVTLMTKQQGVLLVPLVVGALLVGEGRGRPSSQWAVIGQIILRFVLGILLFVLPVIYWDSLRWAVAPSPWDLSRRTYAALTLVPPGGWLGRILAWGDLIWYFTASWSIWILSAVTLAAMLFVRRHKWRDAHISQNHLPFVLLLVVWGAAFLVLHIMTSVKVWDRYLLPLAPVVALLGGWLAYMAVPVLDRRFGLAVVVSMLLMLPPGLAAARGELPIGGDHGAYSGLRSALSWVEEQGDAPVILFHRELGWHHQFYLYDQILSGKTELRWFSSVVYLADNASKAPHTRKFLIQPDWVPLSDLGMHLSTRGLTTKTHLRTGHFTVMELVHAPEPVCTWCVCRPRLDLNRLDSNRLDRPAVRAMMSRR